MDAHGPCLKKSERYLPDSEKQHPNNVKLKEIQQHLTNAVRKRVWNGHFRRQDRQSERFRGNSLGRRYAQHIPGGNQRNY